ncbi:unnamed protein product [Mytilus edulis]|uniref:Uncharacterized protein n=1 Tax=Mytilus edulis TaxID=6550 RepID=A0A8S3V9J3_MYTED|nr:unnamed protein product [Mytilus edulis]
MNEEPNAIKVRVKNVPLSADDDQILRTLETSVSKCEIITHSRERLRIDNLVTNCRTDIFHASENDVQTNEQTEDNDESFQDSDVDSKSSTKPLLNTKGRSRSESDTEHSHLNLGTQESKSAGKDKPKILKSVDRRPGISRYLTTKPSHDPSDTSSSTPKQSKTKNIEKSPVTPTENLHDATRDEAAKKPKKRR